MATTNCIAHTISGQRCGALNAMNANIASKAMSIANIALLKCCQSLPIMMKTIIVAAEQMKMAADIFKPSELPQRKLMPMATKTSKVNSIPKWSTSVRSP